MLSPCRVVTTGRNRLPSFTEIRSFPAIPLHRNNYKIKVDQLKSLIQVNNSFNLFVELYLTCVTGCSIFDNPKNGMCSVMEIHLIARMKEKS
ncbi:hypothetical protein C7S14_0008 [Burkholderia cepacia]|nr:hypothetical protein C7S14_0008 [Burkholderia cepacia]